MKASAEQRAGRSVPVFVLSEKSALIGRATFNNVGTCRDEAGSAIGPIIVKGGNHAVWRRQKGALKE